VPASGAGSGFQCMTKWSPTAPGRLRNSRATKSGESAEEEAPSGSDAETLAALGAARVQDLAAAAGLHADEETVGALAARDRRLESTFHGRGSPKWEKALKRVKALEKLGKSLSLQPIQGLAVNSALGKISTGRVKYSAFQAPFSDPFPRTPSPRCSTNG